MRLVTGVSILNPEVAIEVLHRQQLLPIPQTVHACTAALAHAWGSWCLSLQQSGLPCVTGQTVPGQLHWWCPPMSVHRRQHLDALCWVHADTCAWWR